MANEQELELRARERIALIHAAQGRLREARLALRRVELLSDPDGPSSFTRGARALVAAESLKPEAKDLIEAIVHDEIPDPYWPLLLLGSARWRTAHGGAAAVLEEAALTQISRSVKPQTFARSTLLAIRANALIAMGRPSTATNELGAEETLETPELALARASAEVLCGSPLKGARAMRRLATNQDVGPSVRAEALLMGLWPNPQDSVEAGHTIQVARELIEREGVRRVLLAVPSELSRLVCPGELSAGEQRNPLSAPVVLRGSERRVLVALAEEGSLRDVAHRLGISMNTLKTHARAIYQKLDVSSRADAVRVADRHGLLEQGVDDR
ncbi:LuxR C-terminal-related transcriptional regulator [Microbacterium resistens]|uniref:LuxR C-terminal-related transcriptional regulator n=1 Tax=Microbacterium resistens TaxID=156977 RepID=A0ABY3RMG3_9MICO|nr:LuxR C-terminal-related transcriptional regulator [Microbacterium resistens]UGS24969.1 LuxR C-terminal-related transcriptional regulator [Microbacterium resistens]